MMCWWICSGTDYAELFPADIADLRELFPADLADLRRIILDVKSIASGSWSNHPFGIEHAGCRRFTRTHVGAQLHCIYHFKIISLRKSARSAGDHAEECA